MGTGSPNATTRGLEDTPYLGSTRLANLSDEAQLASTPQAHGRRLLSPAFTPAACAVVVGCAGITAVLGILFAHQSQPGGLDTAVYNWIQSVVGGHQRDLFGLSQLGGFFPVAMMMLVLVLACLMTSRARGALLTVVAVPAAAGTTEFLKPIVGRTYQTGLSFPSGHTTGICVLAAVLAILLLGPLHPPKPAIVRISLVAAGALLAAAVAVALVATDRHYFTDTIGGAAVATAVALLTALIIDRLAGGPRSVSRPPAGDPGMHAE